MTQWIMELCWPDLSWLIPSMYSICKFLSIPNYLDSKNLTLNIYTCNSIFFLVTQLKCDGFIFDVCLNHVMSDATGLKQFMSAVGKMARGADIPSIPPVWERHLLNARDPPRVHTGRKTCISCVEAITASTHARSGPMSAALLMQERLGFFHMCSSPSNNIVEHSFFFSPVEVSLLRRLLPLHLRIAPTAITTIKNLCHNPLGYIVELIKQAKASMTEKYLKSLAALIVIRGKRLYFSDDVESYTKKGEVGTVVPICLLAPAIERF
ncbi:hypothetical protein ES332_D02G025100v1 [Gossypium tomentosum]|uniref:Uncharacterized protein n=1 Tax=Gossypium tomentosum TaxID=34277 RepID=A0A5D2LR94_GOSTO|nr:hypothetical protein ES332_D02G025100v1 [Gossypium tomentosum]